VRLLGAAAAMRGEIGTPLPIVDRAAIEDAMATARAVLGEASFAAAWTAGQALSLEQAITEAATGTATADLAD
jgi:hypothetical protein